MPDEDAGQASYARGVLLKGLLAFPGKPPSIAAIISSSRRRAAQAAAAPRLDAKAR